MWELVLLWQDLCQLSIATSRGIMYFGKAYSCNIYSNQFCCCNDLVFNGVENCGFKIPFQ